MARPGIFLSHSHFDKHFVRRLSGDLQNRGVQVWVDEAEMQVGDSLIEKTRSGIDTMDYLGAVISRHSVRSEWVRREIDVAMNQEIEGRRIKVLPILIDDSDLPGFLLGKLFVDFRKPEKYSDEFERLIGRLGGEKHPSPMMQKLGIPWPLPEAAFVSSQPLRVHITFYDGRRFWFGDPRVGALVCDTRTTVGQLPLNSIAMFHGADLNDGRPVHVDSVRIAHVESKSWLDGAQTLGAAGVDNGDHLVVALCDGTSEKIEHLVALFSWATQRAGKE